MPIQGFDTPLVSVAKTATGFYFTGWLSWRDMASDFRSHRLPRVRGTAATEAEAMDAACHGLGVDVLNANRVTEQPAKAVAADEADRLARLNEPATAKP